MSLAGSNPSQHWISTASNTIRARIQTFGLGGARMETASMQTMPTPMAESGLPSTSSLKAVAPTFLAASGFFFLIVLTWRYFKPHAEEYVMLAVSPDGSAEPMAQPPGPPEMAPNHIPAGNGVYGWASHGQSPPPSVREGGQCWPQVALQSTGIGRSTEHTAATVLEKNTLVLLCLFVFSDFARFVFLQVVPENDFNFETFCILDPISLTKSSVKFLSFFDFFWSTNCMLKLCSQN
eukprot:EG_transcript_25430